MCSSERNGYVTKMEFPMMNEVRNRNNSRTLLLCLKSYFTTLAPQALQNNGGVDVLM